MNITERFIKYVSFDTQSDEDGKGCPSTKKQTIFAKFLSFFRDSWFLSIIFASFERKSCNLQGSK